jgi:hypothetical protein
MGRISLVFAAFFGCALALLLVAMPLEFDVEGGLVTPPSPDEMAGEAERSHELDQRIGAIHLAREERRRIVSNLANGHISLEDAIDGFKGLNELEPIGWSVLQAQYPSSSEEELIGYQLALWTANDQRRCQFVPALIDRLRERFGSRAIIPAHLLTPRRSE